MKSDFIIQKNNLEKWAKDLFPLNRSLTGLGNRKTLNYIKENINKNISIKSVKSNTKVFGWTIPQEWHVTYAKLLDKNKKIISDFKRNNLELLGYSRKIKKKIKFNKFRNLKKNNFYYVDISTKLFNGKMNYGEIFIKGKSKKEILICTYICHPSMANNELSGILAASLISTKIKKTKYSLRIIFIPETIGAIYYIKKNLKHLQKNLVAGFNLSCVGLPGKINIIKTVYENSYVDKICERLSLKNKNIKLLSFLKRGSNERQFGCQNLYLPFVTICTKRFGDFKEYHTSDDSLDILNFKTIINVTKFLKKIVKEINENDIYVKNSYCEPFLSGKKIIKPVSSINNTNLKERINIQNFLAYTNRSEDLKSLSKKLTISTSHLKQISNKLLKHKIIKKYI